MKRGRGKRDRKQRMINAEENYREMMKYYFLLNRTKLFLCLVTIPSIILTSVGLFINFKIFISDRRIDEMDWEVVLGIGSIFWGSAKVFAIYWGFFGLFWTVIDLTHAIPREIFHEKPKERIFSIILIVLLIVRGVTSCTTGLSH